MLELSSKDFKAAIMKMLQQTHKNTVETNGKIKSLSKEIESLRGEKKRYKEEPKGNFKTEKCNNQNLKSQWVSSRTAGRGQRKEPVDLKTEKQK